METFSGHKFWVGLVVGGLLTWFVVPRLLAYTGAARGQ